MAVAGRRVTVTTSPTKLNSDDTDSVSGSTILVRNKHATVSVDIGSDTVASGSGFELAAGESVTVFLQPGDELYADAASGTVTCHVLETGL